jgi:deoxycytidylate deaminase
MNRIVYPYLPEGKSIKYVNLDNEFMKAAHENLDHQGCVKHPTSAVVVKNGKIIGQGTNAGKYVEVCPRWGSPTGKNYGPCKKVCKQDGHAEVTSVANAKKSGHETHGADLYLYGHWWCCEKCWNVMIEAGIENVYLLDKSWKLFNPEVNIVMQRWGKPNL